MDLRESMVVRGQLPGKAGDKGERGPLAFKRENIRPEIMDEHPDLVEKMLAGGIPKQPVRLTEREGKSYDDVVLEDLRRRTAGAGDRPLEDVYGVANPELARVMHHVGSSTEGTLRENMTAGLLGQLAPEGKVKSQYQDITRRVYDRPKKTNEVALDLLTPGDKAWMGEARDMARQLSAGFGDPTKLHQAVSAGGIDPGLIDQMGHAGFADYLQGQQVLNAITRTGDIRGYQSFLDEHGKNLNIKENFKNSRDFSDWLGGTSKSNAFIQGIGDPNGSRADRIRNTEGFLGRIGMLADTGNINNEGMSGDMRTPKLSDNAGMADEHVANTKVSIGDIVREQEDRAARVNRSIANAKELRSKAIAAKKDLVDNHLETLTQIGIDPFFKGQKTVAGKEKAQRRQEKVMHGALAAMASRMTETEYQRNPTAKAMRSAVGFWNARDAAYNAKDALAQQPITAVSEGRRVLDGLNDRKQKAALAEFMAAQDRVLGSLRG